MLRNKNVASIILAELVKSEWVCRLVQERSWHYTDDSGLVLLLTNKKVTICVRVLLLDRNNREDNLHELLPVPDVI